MPAFRLKAVCAACIALLLAGCASVPEGPTLPALQGSRKSAEQFAADDRQCRAVATDRLGGLSPSEAANQTAAAGAVAGTAIGAVTGALIDGSSGAAAGAGMGLLFGLMTGTANSQGTYAVTQQQYDGAYHACMYARGHKVPVPANSVNAYRAQFEAAPPRAAAPVPPPPPPGLVPPDDRPPPPR